MKKAVRMICAALAVATCLAGTPQDEKPKGMSAEEFDFVKTTGGLVSKPNTGYGVFAFVNKQSKIPVEELSSVATYAEYELSIDAVVASERGNAAAWVDVIDKPGESSLAIYPDEKRATVNVAALNADSPSKGVLASRVRKEMFRALSFVLGISGGGEPGRILDVMSDMKRLDAAAEEIPGEMVMRFEQYAIRSGIKPYYRISYADACQEGWAPEPTNIWQKAIWDREQQRKADKADPTNRWKRDFSDKEKANAK